MIVKYCPFCEGKPYTLDFSMKNCPACGGRLLAQEVDDDALAARKQIETRFEIPADSESYLNDEDIYLVADDVQLAPTSDDELAEPLPDTADLMKQLDGSHNDQTMIARHPGNVVRGKIIQYTSTGKEDGGYRRLLPFKIYQAVVYRQRMEDVLHRFTVRVEMEKDELGFSSFVDVPVNVHGTIAGGVQLLENMEVEVCGKYCNGILMAEKIDVINTGFRTRVNFQRSVGAVALGIVGIIALIFLIFVGVSGPYDFFSNIGTFLGVWIGCLIIKLVLYIIFLFTRVGVSISLLFRKRAFSFSGLLIVSFICAVVFYFLYVAI